MLIAQLSDPHLNHQQPGKAQRLDRALAYLLALPRRPDALLISGDCTDHGYPDEYAALRALLEPLPMPCYVVPGNHDDRAALRACLGVPGTHILPGFYQYAVEDLPVRILALDTHIPGQAGGELCAARLEWLETRLAEQPARPTLLMMHHPPIRSGLQVMDSIGLAGTERLRDLVSRHPQVLRIVAGHVHMALTQGFAGTTVMTCPAPDATLLPDLSQPTALVAQQQTPLCLLHAWQEATGLLSYTSVIAPFAWTTLHDGQGWVG